jgi:hypothetical protein
LFSGFPPHLERNAVGRVIFLGAKKVDGAAHLGLNSGGARGREGSAWVFARFLVPKMSGIRGHRGFDLDSLLSKSPSGIWVPTSVAPRRRLAPQEGQGPKTLHLEVGVEIRRSSGTLVGICRKGLQEGGRWVVGCLGCEWEATNFPGGLGTVSFRDRSCAVLELHQSWQKWVEIASKVEILIL